LEAEEGQEDQAKLTRRNMSLHCTYTALAMTSLAIGGLVLAGKLGELFVLSSVAVLAQYAVSAAALAMLAAQRRRGLRRMHIWPAPLALAAVVLVGAAARPVELVVAAGALAVGGVLLVARRSVRGS